MPNKMKTPVTFEVSLPFSIKKKANYFVSSCPVLDVWSQGETKEKAIENLREALQLFLLYYNTSVTSHTPARISESRFLYRKDQGEPYCHEYAWCGKTNSHSKI